MAEDGAAAKAPRAAKKWLPAVCGLAAVASAVLLSLQAGRVGFMPLDQSIVFDGGYRVLTGQLPLRDFVAPAGALPSVLQAGFFALLGTTWFAYCLHAALLDALFVLLVYCFVRQLGGGRLVAWAWAAASGVIFVPPVGTPLVDHHAFFFGLASVVAMLAAGTAGRRASLGLAAAVPVLLLASMLSKPTVAPFLVPPLLLALARAGRARRARLVAGLGTGVGLALALAVATAFGAGIPWQRAAESLWEVPMALGRSRAGMAADRARGLLRDVVALRWLSPFAALGASLWLAASKPQRPLGSSSGPAGEAAPAPGLDLALSATMLLAGVAHALVSFRSSWTSWGYLFAALGGVQAVGARRLAARPAAAGALTLALLLVAAHDAARLHWRITRTRFVTLLSPAHLPREGESVRLPEPLSYLRWAAPAYFGYRWQDLSGVVRFFDDHPGGFWLVGDSTILYALTGRRSVHPTLWLFPPPASLSGGGRHRAVVWQRRLLGDLDRRRVRYVVLEGSLTQMGASLKSFPAVAEAVGKGTVDERRIGVFTILRVRPKVWKRALAELPRPRRRAHEAPQRPRRGLGGTHAAGVPRTPPPVALASDG